MRNTDLNGIWDDLQKQYGNPDRRIERIVYLQLLYRAYIGIQGIPSRRFLILEIPVEKQKEFNSFVEPKGLELKVETVGNEKPGFISCFITSAYHEMNDVFSVVAEDILRSLADCKNEDHYIDTLKKRINHWRDFFSSRKSSVLSEYEVIGLIGELQFIKDLLDNDVPKAVEMWNGPIKAAQDFQSEEVAVEVKTTAANKIDRVKIADLSQLYKNEREHLFLCIYRMEADQSTGFTLPEFIDLIRKNLTSENLRKFNLDLECIGYTDETANQYTKKYGVREKKCFEVVEGFPSITPEDVPAQIEEASYILKTSECNDYMVDFADIINTYEG